MAGKGLTWPIRRLLDPRFHDLSERIWNTRLALEEEAQRTRSSVSENVDAVVGGYAATSVESLQPPRPRTCAGSTTRSPG